jgi:hypothetical protein
VRIGGALLDGSIGDSDALEAGREPRPIHHGDMRATLAFSSPIGLPVAPSRSSKTMVQLGEPWMPRLCSIESGEAEPRASLNFAHRLMQQICTIDACF